MNYKHGYSKKNNVHPLYDVWCRMKTRCNDKNVPRYEDWGGRGITICNEWENYPVVFIDWALNNGWENKLCLDRINNNGNYEPSNCRFVTAQVSNCNTRLLSRCNKSGYRGVSWHNIAKKWVAQIKVRGKVKHLGIFNSPRIAAIAYDTKAYKLNDGRPTNFF